MASNSFSSRRRASRQTAPPDPPEPVAPQREAVWQPALVCILLAALTAAAYWPARHNQFVDFDDPQYIAGNPHVRSGLTLREAGWVFRHFYFNNYHPLTLISYMLDVQLFGLDPPGFHLTNVLLHVINSMLLFLLLRRMMRTTWP